MEIHTNNPNHLKDFVQLNEKWLSEYFTLEDIDRKLSSNPDRIIKKGGFIFTITENNTLVGCCALIKHGNDLYETTRLGVLKDYRHKGYAQVLLNTAFDKLRELGETRTFVLTNSVLKSTVALYKKNNFVVISEEQHPIYRRCNLLMECWL